MTSLRNKNELVAALLKEMDIRQKYFGDEVVETIYLGGGTPSLLESGDVKLLMEKVASLWSVLPQAEVTLEANPDDITLEKLENWKTCGINRLSLGIQSFFDADLEWMNRAHTAKQAIGTLQLAKSMFENISIDLIYGTPGLSNERWKHNVETALSFNIPHLSCYALTVEPKTPLDKMIRTGKSKATEPGHQSDQFLLLMKWLDAAGYEQYEISNFSLPGLRSRHNSSYWMGKKYLGIGPAAHSFDGQGRQWNVSNNRQYIDSIQKGVIPAEMETLSPVQQVNEYIMTSLRTSEGIALSRLDGARQEFLIERTGKYIRKRLMIREGDSLRLTREGKLLADGIAADLFFT